MSDLPSRIDPAASGEAEDHDVILPPRRLEDREFLGDFMPGRTVPKGSFRLLDGDGDDDPPPAPR